VAPVRGERSFASDELQPGAADEFGHDPACTGWRCPDLDLPE
jgi:hypothetical protein